MEQTCRLGRRAGPRLVWLAPLALVAALAAGCGREPVRPAAGSAAAEQASWFVIRNGRLEPGARPTRGGSSDADFLPWTLQTRVADLAFRDGTLYAAVNGHGVATLPLPPARGARFAATEDLPRFAGRTVTELFSDEQGIVVHLYANEILAAAAPQSARPTGGPLALLAIGGGSGGAPLSFAPVAIPFHAEHPAWEAVAAVRVSPGELAFEWKRSGDDRTEFAYTRFAWRSGAERPSDRRSFRDSWSLRPAATDPDAAVRELFDAVSRHISAAGKDADAAVHLTIRAEGQVDARYRYQPPGYAYSEDPDLVSVPARRSAGGLYALLPDGTLFASRGATAPGVASHALPALPEGHRYTGFVVAASGDALWVAAAWEEERFPRVGAAGLYLGTIGQPKP